MSSLKRSYCFLSPRCIGTALIAVSTLLAGCEGGGSKKGRIVVYQYPEFYQPELKTIAVLPFRDPPQGPGVGQKISDEVATLLTKNGTYEVYTRTHLADLLAERDLVDAGIIDADMAMQIGQAKSVQALVCGVCTRCEAVSKDETRYTPVPIWGRNERGKQVIVGFDQKPYMWTRNDAFVECNVVVIDAKTGRHIGAVKDPSNLSDGGSPPHKSPPELLAMAEEDQAARVARGIAVTRTEIKLRGDVIRTASDIYDNKWEWKDRFAPTSEKVFVVVKLPQEADRNNFKITIVPKEGREVVAEQDFVWSKQDDRKGFPFEVKGIVEKFGLGEYKAKLYSGPEPIATRNFRIVEKD
jgi:hypothetical protein